MWSYLEKGFLGGNSILFQCGLADGGLILGLFFTIRKRETRTYFLDDKWGHSDKVDAYKSGRDLGPGKKNCLALWT